MRKLFVALLLSASLPVAAGAGVVYRGNPHVFVEPMTHRDGSAAQVPTTPPKVPSARLSASPGALTGLDVVKGVSPALGTVTISNEGDAASAIPQVSLAGPFEIVSSACVAALSPGDSCAVAVRGKAVADGALAGSLTVAGVADPVPLSGTASGFAAATVSASEWRVVLWINDAYDGGLMVPAEIEFRQVPGAKINPGAGGVASVAQETYFPWKSPSTVDGDDATYAWLSNGGDVPDRPADPRYDAATASFFELRVAYPSAIAPKEVYLRSADDSNLSWRMPKSFYVQYKSGGTWKTLKRFEGVPAWSVGQGRTFALD